MNPEQLKVSFLMVLYRQVMRSTCLPSLTKLLRNGASQIKLKDLHDAIS